MKMKLLLVWILVESYYVHAFVGFRTTSHSRGVLLLHAKRKFKINTNIKGDVSSDGLLAEKKKNQEKENAARAAVVSNLGVSNKKKMSSNGGQGGKKKISKKAEKLAKQRNGEIDSTLQAGLALPEDQNVQIQVVKRGNKQATVVRGLTSAMEDRKKLLKELKSKLGGGGSLIEGVLELQGAHGSKILELMRKKGYIKSKLIK